MISKMKVDELKIYLRIRGLKVSGKKEELVARVFVAQENNVKPTLSAEEVEVALGAEYQSKLEDINIPDPKSLTGWVSEENGIKEWPIITYGNIFNYIMFYPSELTSDD